MADLTLDITSELPKAIKWLGTIRGQMPFAVSQALNRTGFDVRRKLNEGAVRHFNASGTPTRFTQTAFVVERGNKADPTVLVGAQANRDYFGAQIRGGQRRPKEYEGFLRGISGGKLRGKLVPTRNARDERGNPPKRLFSQIGRSVQSNRSSGFFIGKPKGSNDRPSGVYRRLNGKLQAMFVEIQEPRYEPRFPLVEIGTEEFQRVAGGYLRSSLERALASAR